MRLEARWAPHARKRGSRYSFWGEPHLQPDLLAGGCRAKMSRMSAVRSMTFTSRPIAFSSSPAGRASARHVEHDEVGCVGAQARPLLRPCPCPRTYADWARRASAWWWPPRRAPAVSTRRSSSASDDASGPWSRRDPPPIGTALAASSEIGVMPRVMTDSNSVMDPTFSMQRRARRASACEDGRSGGEPLEKGVRCLHDRCSILNGSTAGGARGFVSYHKRSFV